MIIQKIYKAGNAKVVTIPRQFLNELNLNDGSEVTVERKQNQIIISPKQKVKAPGVNSKFMEMVDEFITDHEDVLRQLANK